MWQLIKYFGLAGFFGGFLMAVIGHEHASTILAALSFPLFILGMCAPKIFMPAEEFDERESVFGVKLYLISFIFMGVVVSISWLLHLREETSHTLLWIVAVPFSLGLLLNVYKIMKNTDF